MDEFELANQNAIDTIKKASAQTEEDANEELVDRVTKLVTQMAEAVLVRIDDIESKLPNSDNRTIGRLSGSEDLSKVIEKINEIVDLANKLSTNNKP